MPNAAATAAGNATKATAGRQTAAAACGTVCKCFSSASVGTVFELF